MRYGRMRAYPSHRCACHRRLVSHEAPMQLAPFPPPSWQLNQPLSKWSMLESFDLATECRDALENYRARPTRMHNCLITQISILRRGTACDLTA
jgi:hypothetical protein